MRGVVQTGHKPTINQAGLTAPITMKITAPEKGGRDHAKQTEHTVPASQLCSARSLRYDCDKHRALHPEETRSAGSRGYGAAWNRARKRYLETHPLCVECMKQGRYVKATDVDHIKPHRGDSVLFWDQSNWQSLCHRHHSIKTRNEDHTPEYKY